MKTVAVAAGLALVAVLSRHERAAFALDRELAENAEPLGADAPLAAPPR